MDARTLIAWLIILAAFAVATLLWRNAVARRRRERHGRGHRIDIVTGAGSGV